MIYTGIVWVSGGGGGGGGRKPALLNVFNWNRDNTDNSRPT